MRKILILSAAAAALGLFAIFAPADAATRNAAGVANAQVVQMDLSARRYHRRYYRRYYRGYYGGGPYYYRPYPYYYRPYGYYPNYYQRPGLYFRFGW